MQYNAELGGWYSLAWTDTDADGNYRLAGLVAGIYRVEFVDATFVRYLTEYYDNATTVESAQDITVNAGATVSGIDAALALLGHVTGRVTDRQGQPLPDIQVTAYRYTPYMGGWYDYSFAITDANGNYDLRGFAPGSYRVRFIDGAGRYATQFYKNARDIDHARDITVALSEIVTGIDAKATEQPSAAQTQANTALWTRWHPTQYALAEEAQALWIGAAGGVVRWDKSSKSHQRYTAVDGLPHQNVDTVALDDDGNRWFGGDGGLSRLDAANHWSHFTTANSGLHSNRVDGIAVGADNTLWVSHGLPTGSLSRRASDGSWRWFPSRAVAVTLDYVRIQQTRNVNPLWTVVGAEVWVSYAVYNGNQWLDRTPDNVTNEPKVVAVDSQDAVWVLGDHRHVFTWRGSSWSTRDVQQTVPSFYQLTTLAVGPDDSVWVGWAVGPGPFSQQDAGFGRLQDQTIFQTLQRPTPLAALLPTAAGLWAVGPGWLRQADGGLYDFPDAPIYTNLQDALVDGAGTLWLASRGPGLTRDDRLQTIVDQGTATLSDDQWRLPGVPELNSLIAIYR